MPFFYDTKTTFRDELEFLLLILLVAAIAGVSFHYGMRLGEVQTENTALKQEVKMLDDFLRRQHPGAKI